VRRLSLFEVKSIDMGSSSANRPFLGALERVLSALVVALAFPVAGLRADEAGYIGTAVCVECHEEEAARWKGSDHDLAMRQASKETVFGAFDGTQFSAHGVTSTFSQRDGRYFVRTDGPDGALQDFEIAFTFGHRPLQQYLVAFPKGRYQALNIAWDTRPGEQGGQRWFHLYPDDPISHRDVLHWTGIAQNWNTMCADCHSTNLRKGYRPDVDRYETTWSEVNVGCESCHGPAAEHVAWARRPSEERRSSADNGLRVRLREGAATVWKLAAGASIAQPSSGAVSRVEIETCAPCHSRRGEIAAKGGAVEAYLDRYQPALLLADLYHPDGQIDGEVYVYGSFLQSKMYRAGVTCRDCHDPHSLTTAGGNAVCGRCHAAATFDTETHHHHPVASEGAQCAACHMPAKTYMVVDPRRDHSFRIPRPDLSRSIGVPNACTGCHTDRSDEWADDTVRRWYGNSRKPHFGEAIHAGRAIAADAEKRLVALAGDAMQPGIARATAVSMLPSFPGPNSTAAIAAACRDSDPLLRMAAAGAGVVFEPEARFRTLAPLLDDPLRAVRIEAARSLAVMLRSEMPAGRRESLMRGLAEYRDAQLFSADRAEAHVNLGTLALEVGDADTAQAAYRRALEVGPYFLPAYVNLADLYRSQGNDDDGEVLLRKALTVDAQNAAVRHALGLLLVREQRLAEAIDELRAAATADPETPRYAYVYAMGLHAVGRADAALDVLREIHRRFSGERDALFALATMSRDKGEVEEALAYATKLSAVVPHDPGVAQLVAQLSAAKKSP
jgi:tetratricopeptide (TPR) repeat protein